MTHMDQAQERPENTVAARSSGPQLIHRDGILSGIPPVREGFCIVCRFDPGFGRPEKQVICSSPLLLNVLNERFVRGEILNVRWYHGRRQDFEKTIN